MKLKLMKLDIKDFAGIKEQSFNFNGVDAAIYGANAAGKTTTAVALQWLLFDKGLNGKTIDPVPRDSNNIEQYELTPIVTAVFDMEGTKLVLSKESAPKYTKNQMTGAKEYTKSRTMKQYINDVPATVTNYKKEIAEIVSEDVFKLVTNPQSFNDLHWTERRKMLFEVCGSKSDEQIIEENKELHPLKDILKGKSIDDQKKVIKDKLKKTNDDIEDIPVRINEANNSKIEVKDVDIEHLEKLKTENKEIESEISSIENGSEEIRIKNEAENIRQKIKHLEDNFTDDNTEKIRKLESKRDFDADNRTNFESKLIRINADIKKQENLRKQKLEEHKQVKEEIKTESEKVFEFNHDDVCKCCGQKIPEENIESARVKAEENFNQQKSEKIEALNNRLNSIVEEGKNFKPIIEALNDDKDKTQTMLDNVNKTIEHYTNQILELNNDAQDVRETNEYKQLLHDFNDLQKQRQELNSINFEKTEDLRNKIAENEREIMFIQESIADHKSNERIDKRIEELRNEEDHLVSIKEQLHYQLHLIELFERTKVNAIEEGINEKFKIARFKLFDEKKNGNIEDTCITLVDGVEYDKGLNNAARINVGLDIINTLSKHFNFYAPIFIDNAESVTDVLETESQQIKLIVSEKDSILRMV